MPRKMIIVLPYHRQDLLDIQISTGHILDNTENKSCISISGTGSLRKYFLLSILILQNKPWK
jgi:hypothetical protein